MISLTLLVLANLLVTSAASSPQDTSQLPTAQSSDDIIVSALRLPREKLPVQVHWDNLNSFEDLRYYERADAFVRCAKDLISTDDLRQVIDGSPNIAKTRYVQGRIVVGNSACYPSAPAVTTGNLADYGIATVDRGAILIYVLQRYAPDAKLTEADMENVAVRDRFRHRESDRIKLMFREDRDVVVLAACLVRVEPALATRLMKSKPGSSLEQGLEQAILVDGRGCLLDTKRVSVSPVSLRIALADTFYRWLVAVRNVPTLIIG